MTAMQVSETIGLKVLAVGIDQEVTGGFTSDLLSDVIANADEGALWITVQRHINIVAVAQLKKVAGIVLAGNAVPDAAVVEKAALEKIFIFQSRDSAFAVSGKLYALLAAKAQ